MINIIERLRFDAVRCELQFSKGVATNIDEAAARIEQLEAALREIKDQYLTPDQSSAIAREALDKLLVLQDRLA